MSDDADAYVRGVPRRAARCRTGSSAITCSSTPPRRARAAWRWSPREVVIRRGPASTSSRTARAAARPRRWSPRTRATTCKAYAFARAGTEPLKFRDDRRARLPDRLRHLRRPRAAHLPADRRGHRPLQPRVPDLHRRQPVLEPHGARDVRADRRRPGRGRGHVRVARALRRRADEPPADPRADRRSRPAPRSGASCVITNGIRLGKDRAFAQALKEPGVYVGLQLDGFTAEVHEKIRGSDLVRGEGRGAGGARGARHPDAADLRRDARRQRAPDRPGRRAVPRRGRTSCRSTSSPSRTPATAAARSSTIRSTASPSPASSGASRSRPAASSRTPTSSRCRARTRSACR